jgi:hypothetical protein
MMSELKRYRKALDEVLKQSPDALLAFMRARGMPEPSCREILEMTFHKSITASTTLPFDYRKKSKAWLQDRAFHPLDDGDVK